MGYEPKPCMAWLAYNDNLRLNTIRHAMVAQLRSPAAGFEAVARGPPTLQIPSTSGHFERE